MVLAGWRTGSIVRVKMAEVAQVVVAEEEEVVGGGGESAGCLVWSSGHVAEVEVEEGEEGEGGGGGRSLRRHRCSAACRSQISVSGNTRHTGETPQAGDGGGGRLAKMLLTQTLKCHMSIRARCGACARAGFGGRLTFWRQNVTNSQSCREDTSLRCYDCRRQGRD